jgi:multidrug efflux system membrane fusion protein
MGDKEALASLQNWQARVDNVTNLANVDALTGSVAGTGIN